MPKGSGLLNGEETIFSEKSGLLNDKKSSWKKWIIVGIVVLVVVAIVGITLWLTLGTTYKVEYDKAIEAMADKAKTKKSELEKTDSSVVQLKNGFESYNCVPYPEGADTNNQESLRDAALQKALKDLKYDEFMRINGETLSNSTDSGEKKEELINRLVSTFATVYLRYGICEFSKYPFPTFMGELEKKLGEDEIYCPEVKEAMVHEYRKGAWNAKKNGDKGTEEKEDESTKLIAEVKGLFDKKEHPMTFSKGELPLPAACTAENPLKKVVDSIPTL